MGSETDEEEEQSSATAPKLALLLHPPMKSAADDDANEYPGRGIGMSTPPRHHTVSVPFGWEEEPGKPRPCKSLSLPTTTTTPLKGLELPPRLLYGSKFTKTPSPTTVLEGPYVGRSIFHSLRLIRNRRPSSFDGSDSSGSSPERGLLGSMVLITNKERRGGLFGSWRKKASSLKLRKEVAHEGSFVFSTCPGDGDVGAADPRVQLTRSSRKRGLLGLTKVKYNFWAAIYGAVKQVIPTPRGKHS